MRKKIARPDDVLKVGDKVNAKIIELDKETRKNRTIYKRARRN